MDRLLKHQLTSLMAQPGIYQFFDRAGSLLYVGKAKNLKVRVQSYFQVGANLSPAKAIMVKTAHHLSITVVNNETEALLLEANLIKQRQPPYNIVLKDDKSWLYFAIDYRQPYPRVSLERRPIVRGVKYFGPYPQSSTARYTLQLLKKTLGLKTCTNEPGNPCFASRLGRCLGHNLSPGSQPRYQQALQSLEQILRGHNRQLALTIKRKMEQAAKARQFEVAAKLRDQYRALERLAIRQSMVSPPRESYDVFGLTRDRNQAAICRLPVRRGALLESERFLLNQTSGLNDSEILADFLIQYYPQATERPKLAYLPIKISEASIVGVKLTVPARGKKRALLKIANGAALTHLRDSVASWQRREVRAQAGLLELQKLFKLPTPPQRIEGYDVSNIQGLEAVGSMVVLSHGLPHPQAYRQFKIQRLKSPDDPAMLAEVLERRFTKNNDWPKPDLVMLDGGQGQLSVVGKALAQVGVKIRLIALAKREELIYLPKSSQPIKLPPESPALLLLQELRDEAHRFGITFYRKRHRRANLRSGWDELPGIGPVLKRKLKSTFGTLGKLRQVNLSDLAKVVGVKRSQDIKQQLG